MAVIPRLIRQCCPRWVGRRATASEDLMDDKSFGQKVQVLTYSRAHPHMRNKPDTSQQPECPLVDRVEADGLICGTKHSRG